MKRFCLLTIIILSGLSDAVGQTAVHTDLVVAAEVVHTVKAPERLVNATQFIPYLRLIIRNRTNHSRKVTFMSCSWSDSWNQKGAYGLCGGWICEKNNPITITIPVGKVLVFCGLMCGKQDEESVAGRFSMGFTDYAESHFWPWLINKKGEKKRKSPTVYWSNELNGRINIANTPEVAEQYLGHYYSLEAGK